MSDQNGKVRVIAVEEHIVTDGYIEEAARLAVGPGEEAEQSFMAGFNADPESRRRIVDLDVRLGEMDASGTDVAVLSLNPPGVQLFRDGEAATALARRLNGLAGRPDREAPHPLWRSRRGCAPAA